MPPTILTQRAGLSLHEHWDVCSTIINKYLLSFTVMLHEQTNKTRYQRR